MPRLLLRSIRVDPARGGERAGQLPFLQHGLVEVELHSPLTFLVGENGSGKTTLLEAVAAQCAIRPGGGRSYAETDGDRDATALSSAVEVAFPAAARVACSCAPTALPRPWPAPAASRCLPLASGAPPTSKAAGRACCPC